MAAESKSRPEVCCRWPNRYPAEWQQAYQAGRWKVVYEVHIEAVQTLKDLLHSKDERIRANAATLLKKYERELRSVDNKARNPLSASDSGR